ncbi:MAG: hypothetical protein ACOCUT_01565 [bacterium]
MGGSTQNKLPPIDFIEELSEATSLAYPTVLKILAGLKNKKEIIKAPNSFLQEASKKIQNVELDQMLRALDYRLTGESFDIANFDEFIERFTENIEPTPNRGLYDSIVWDSKNEKSFASFADQDTQVVCFLKLPDFYKISTPAGMYTPDFGIVYKRKKIKEEKSNEYYFVIEIKGTNSIEDRKALSENEIYKIKCAVKHFEALGIETKVNYIAPVKEYNTFKDKAEEIKDV